MRVAIAGASLACFARADYCEGFGYLPPYQEGLNIRSEVGIGGKKLASFGPLKFPKSGTATFPYAYIPAGLESLSRTQIYETVDTSVAHLHSVHNSTGRGCWTSMEGVLLSGKLTAQAIISSLGSIVGYLVKLLLERYEI